MPAVVKSTVGSFSGMSEAEGITACPFDLKNDKYISLRDSEVSFFIYETSCYILIENRGVRRQKARTLRTYFFVISYPSLPSFTA